MVCMLDTCVLKNRRQTEQDCQRVMVRAMIFKRVRETVNLCGIGAMDSPG